MEMKFLTEPAVLIDNILVIADLHIGIEQELARSGITIPSQLPGIQKRIDSLLKETKARHLIILGDVKHMVPEISWQEKKELPEFLKQLSDRVKTSIVKGNHDGNIEYLAPEGVDVYDSDGFRIENFGFVHGHAWPDKQLLDCEYLIIAHAHPAIEFYSGGARIVEHVWLRCPVNKKVFERRYKKECRLREAIIMPAFNTLSGGSAFNSKDFRPIGPLLTNNAVLWKQADVYLLDGTLLGKLEKLKI
ncbi:MAG: metallophosphoesterase [Candidatus Aenigmatarchaeota archaeon]